MVQNIGGRLDTTPHSTPTTHPNSLAAGAAFDGLLGSLLNDPSAGPQETESNALTAADCAPAPRVGVEQSLHYLHIRTRPQPAIQFSPVPLVHTSAAGGGTSLPGLLRGQAAHASGSASMAPAAGAGLSGPGTRFASNALALEDYPRPPADNGRGMHWIPTMQQSPEVVDRFMERLQALDVRWVTFLNEPGDLKGNDYLVRRLVSAGIMPVMRVYTDSGAAVEQDLRPLVEHYRKLGVSYFQLFNEPNLVCESQGQAPDANEYLSRWIPAARQVVAAGGLPGLGALSPQGEVDDLDFLRGTLAGLKARGAGDLLGRSWLSVHNYGTDHLRIRQYAQVVREVTGQNMPLIGTEAGIYPGGGLTEDDQVQVVSDAYNYLNRREPYYFAYSLWVLANQAGGGHDARWEHQALYRVDGPTRLAQVLEQSQKQA